MWPVVLSREFDVKQRKLHLHPFCVSVLPLLFEVPALDVPNVIANLWQEIFYILVWFWFWL